MSSVDLFTGRSDPTGRARRPRVLLSAIRLFAGRAYKVAQKMRGQPPHLLSHFVGAFDKQPPHLLSHFVGASDKQPNCAKQNPRPVGPRWSGQRYPHRECSIQTDLTPSVLHTALSHSVVMKAHALRFIASYFPYIPKIVPGVHVGLKDTEGSTIFGI